MDWRSLAIQKLFQSNYRLYVEFPNHYNYTMVFHDGIGLASFIICRAYTFENRVYTTTRGIPLNKAVSLDYIVAIEPNSQIIWLVPYADVAYQQTIQLASKHEWRLRTLDEWADDEDESDEVKQSDKRQQVVREKTMTKAAKSESKMYQRILRGE